MSDFVNIKGQNVYIFNDDSIIEQIEKYIGHDFSEYVRGIFEDTERTNYLEKLKFDSDFEVYEAENECFRDTLNEILSIVQQYQYGVEHKNEPFSRKRVFQLLENICDLIEGVI